MQRGRRSTLVHVTPANWRQWVIVVIWGRQGEGNHTHTDNLQCGGKVVASKRIVFTIRQVVVAVKRGRCIDTGWMDLFDQASRL